MSRPHLVGVGIGLALVLAWWFSPAAGVALAASVGLMMLVRAVFSWSERPPRHYRPHAREQAELDAFSDLTLNEVRERADVHSLRAASTSDRHTKLAYSTSAETWRSLERHLRHHGALAVDELTVDDQRLWAKRLGAVSPVAASPLSDPRYDAPPRSDPKRRDA